MFTRSEYENFKVLVFFTFSGPIYFFVVIFWGGFEKFQSFEDMLIRRLWFEQHKVSYQYLN